MLIAHRHWKASGSTKRYFYTFMLGFLFGSCLYLMSFSFMFSINYDKRVEFVGVRTTTRRPHPLGRSRFTGSVGPWLTPPTTAPTYVIPTQEPMLSKSGIPKVIHQTWENTSIPKQFGKWVSSWEKTHEDWSYLFWTAPGAKNFVKKVFSNYSSLYKSYPTKLQRADARKYFIMYHYGGVFADLDVECYKALDAVLDKYPCILSQEPKAHRALLYDSNIPFVAMPGFMACRRQHPFFKLVIDLLQDYAHDFKYDAIRSTGPRFLTDALSIYLNFYNKTTDEYIYLAPPEWFLPTFDPMQRTSFQIICSEMYARLPAFKQEACDELKAMDFRNEADENSFTDHHWAHTAAAGFKSNGTFPIKQLVYFADII